MKDTHMFIGRSAPVGQFSSAVRDSKARSPRSSGSGVGSMPPVAGSSAVASGGAGSSAGDEWQTASGRSSRRGKSKGLYHTLFVWFVCLFVCLLWRWC